MLLQTRHASIIFYGSGLIISVEKRFGLRLDRTSDRMDCLVWNDFSIIGVLRKHNI